MRASVLLLALALTGCATAGVDRIEGTLTTVRDGREVERDTRARDGARE